MTLEDVIKTGKKEKKVRDSIEDFHNHPYKNVVLELGEVDNSNDIYAQAGINPAMTDSMNQVEMNHFAEEVHKDYRNQLVEKVQEDYAAVIGGIGSGEKGLANLVEFASQFKPVEYHGVNAEAYEAHKKAEKVRKLLEEPEKAYKEIQKKYNPKIAGRAILFLAQKNPQLIEHIIQMEYNRAVKEFGEKLGSVENAASYIKGMYDSLENDDAKKGFAYLLGRELVEPAAERKKKPKNVDEDEFGFD